MDLSELTLIELLELSAAYVGGAITLSNEDGRLLLLVLRKRTEIVNKLEKARAITIVESSGSC